MDAINLDEIAAATVITHGSPFNSIYIPGFESLTTKERRIVIAKAEALHRERTFLDDLNQRLKDLTPPPADAETILEEARALDAAARNDLEELGAPPCYPLSVSLPITSECLPEPQLGAAKYFEHIAPHDGAVLTSQLSMWNQFRKYQEHTRCPNRKSEFQRSTTRIRKRYGGRKGSGRYMLLADHTKQTKMQNWTEYQELELSRMERLKDEKARLQHKLAIESARQPRPDLRRRYYALEVNDSKMAYHSQFLIWIEWEWERIAALEKASSGVYHRSDTEIALTHTCTHGKYNLRPRKNGRASVAKTHALTKPQPTRRKPQVTEGFAAARIRSGRVSKPPTRW